MHRLICAILAVTSLLLQAVPSESCSAISIATPRLTYHPSPAISTKITAFHAAPSSPPPPCTPYASHSYLAGIGIRSSVQAGLGSQFDPEIMWNSVTDGMLKGIVGLTMDYAGQTLDLDPHISTLAFRAISGTIEGALEYKGDMVRGIIEAATNSTYRLE